MTRSLTSFPSRTDDARAYLAWGEIDLDGLIARVRPSLPRPPLDVIVTGALFNRVIVLVYEPSRAVFATPFGPLGLLDLARRFVGEIVLDWPEREISSGTISGKALTRLSRPHIRMVALYHLENFPFPRFPLGISDIAAAVRSRFLGRVSLRDMQFGADVEQVVEEIASDRPDIIGISATFGQQDLLERVVEGVRRIPRYQPLLVAGGSLAARNAEHLLERYPEVIVAIGAGEATMVALAEHWHGERALEDVTDIAWRDASGRTRYGPRPVGPVPVGIPELDLLEDTLRHRGVMQLESSRGCTFACSFCPRDHKGRWSGGGVDELAVIMPHIERVYARYPEIPRRIFLVDEEFIGYAGDEDSLERARVICDLLSVHGFTFESSTRVDQVYRPQRGPDWHVQRVSFWRYMVKNGLRRMLFGIESGVDSILERFNKKTTSAQNVHAVRLLTACGVPVRLTYITFDPLMTLDELIDTYRFQGRRDLLLRALPGLSDREIYSVVHDEALVARSARSEPLYHEIPYMLVSMECLLGSKYLQMVEESGLARDVSLSMGRQHADYRDPRIGLMSFTAQRWIDRSFALDYLLKSIDKVADGAKSAIVREIRAVLRDYAYGLLGRMLHLITGDAAFLPDMSGPWDDNTPRLRDGSRSQALSGGAADGAAMRALLDAHFERLRAHVVPLLEKLAEGLDLPSRGLLRRTVDAWISRRDWALIND
jgi:radical SAM superfamily enzyme YgiQ (UPF0313 family)